MGLNIDPGARKILDNYFQQNNINSDQEKNEIIADAAALVDDPTSVSAEEAQTFVDITNFVKANDSLDNNQLDNPHITISHISKTNFIRDLYTIEIKASGINFSQDMSIISDCIKNARLAKRKLDDLTPAQKITELHQIIQDTLAKDKIVLKAEKTDLLLAGLQNGTLDCDTYAYLFAAVAHELSWPVSLYITKDGSHVLLGYEENDKVAYFNAVDGKPQFINDLEVIRLNLDSNKGLLIAQFWANLGNWHYDHGNYDKATACYQTALEKNPENINALINLGNIYATKGNSQQAQELYSRASAFYADSKEAAYNSTLIQAKKTVLINELKMVSPQALSAPQGLAGLPIVGTTIQQWQSQYYEMNQGAADSFGTPSNPGGYTGGVNGDPDATGILDGFGGRLYADDLFTDFNPALDSPDNEPASPWTLQRGGAGPHYTGGYMRNYFDKASGGVDQTRTLAYDSGGAYVTETVPEFATRHFDLGGGSIQLIPTAGGLTIDCQNLSATAENNGGGFTTTRRYYLGYIVAGGDFLVQQVFNNTAALQNAALTANIMDGSRTWVLCYVDEVNLAGKNFYLKSRENINLTPFIQQFKANYLKKVDLGGNGLLSVPVYNGGTLQYETTYTSVNSIPAAPAGVTYEYALVWDGGGEQILAGFNPNVTSTISMTANPFNVTNLGLVCRTLVENVGGTGYLNSDGSTAATSSTVDLVGAPILINASPSQTRTLTGVFKNTGQTAGVYEYTLTGANASPLLSGMFRVWYAAWDVGGVPQAPVVIADPTGGGIFNIPSNPNPTTVTNMHIYYADDFVGNPGTPEVSASLLLFSNATANAKFKGAFKVTTDPANISTYHYSLQVATGNPNSYTPLAAGNSRTFYVQVNGINVANFNHLPTSADLDTALAAANPFTDNLAVYYIDTYPDTSTDQSEIITLINTPTQLINRYDPSISPLNTGNSRNSLIFAAETDTTTSLPIIAVKFITTRPVCPYLLDGAGNPISADFTKTELSDGRYQWTASFSKGIYIADIRTQDCGETEYTVTYVGGSTQTIKLFNTENPQLLLDKTAQWGETLIQPGYYTKYSVDLNALKDSAIIPVGGKILEQLGFSEKDLQLVQVAYQNHLNTVGIYVSRLDNKKDILDKIFKQSIISEEDLYNLAPDKVVDDKIVVDNRDARKALLSFIYPKFFDEHTDDANTKFYTFKPGLKKDQIASDFEEALNTLGIWNLDINVFSFMDSAGSKINAILRKNDGVISESELNEIEGSRLFKSLIFDSAIYFDYASRNNEKRYILRKDVSLETFAQAFDANTKKLQEYFQNLKAARNNLLSLFDEHPAAEDAKGFVENKPMPWASVRVGPLFGKGPWDYLGLDLTGKFIGLAIPKIMQFGLNYDLEMAKYFADGSPDTLFWKARLEPYWLMNFSGFRWNFNGLLNIYNDQLYYQDKPFVGCYGGLGMYLGYENWCGASIRFLGDSFSKRNYIEFDTKVEHDFNFVDKTSPDKPFLSAFGFKLGWNPEIIYSTFPMTNTAYNIKKFTAGLRFSFFDAVQLSAECQQSFDWSAENGQNTVVLAGLKGLNPKFPWSLDTKFILQPGFNEIDFAAGIDKLPLSFGFFTAMLNISQKTMEDISNNQPTIGLDLGLTIQAKGEHL